MANLHSKFKEFNGNLNISNTKSDNLASARKALTKKLKDHFREEEDYSTPTFWTQGSFQMGTTIKTESGDCDLDLGVYFSKVPNVSCETIQANVMEVIKDHTDTPPNHKKRCVRVNYAGAYHIDLPIYLKTDEMNHPELSVKGEEFQESDPKEFYDWFNEKCKGFPQKRRLIRYLKAWADKHKSKMPSGLALTVLAIQKYVENERDDLALLNTVNAIKTFVNATWSCYLPACPNDDVLARLDDDQKSRFIEALGTLSDKLEEAIGDDVPSNEAMDICYQLFGNEFPLSEKSKRLGEKALLMTKGLHSTTKEGVITDNKVDSIKNKEHKFYGE